jgi:hypothetical protein
VGSVETLLEGCTGVMCAAGRCTGFAGLELVKSAAHSTEDVLIVIQIQKVLICRRRRGLRPRNFFITFLCSNLEIGLVTKQVLFLINFLIDYNISFDSL